MRLYLIFSFAPATGTFVRPYKVCHINFIRESTLGLGFKGDDIWLYGYQQISEYTSSQVHMHVHAFPMQMYMLS